jgi:hypothetical protein
MQVPISLETYNKRGHVRARLHVLCCQLQAA